MGTGVGLRAFFVQIERSRGNAPALRLSKPSPFTVGRGPVPRRASVGMGNGLGLRAFFARVLRSRGPVPRATVGEAAARLTRSRSGEPELRSLGHADDRGGQAPALRTNRANLVNPVNPAHIVLIL